MAASAWGFFNQFKRYMADGEMDLDLDVFKMALFTSAADADTRTQSIWSELSSEVAAANNYALGGKTLTNVTWSTGASAGVMRFDSDNVIWTASGGNISAIRYAVIHNNSGASIGANKLVCSSRLTATAFSVSDGNTLTITINASGIFELT